jgi:serine/threonine protein kinase
VGTKLLASDSIAYPLISYAKQAWGRFVTAETQPHASSESLDLIEKLLRYDHRERLTAAEAQAHTFFSETPVNFTHECDLSFPCRLGTSRSDLVERRKPQRLWILLNMTPWHANANITVTSIP